MPTPIGDLIRMPKGTRELYVLEAGTNISYWQKKAASYARKAGVMKFQSCILVQPDKTVLDCVWIEIIEPVEARKPGRWDGYRSKEADAETEPVRKRTRAPGESLGRGPLPDNSTNTCDNSLEELR